MATTPTDNHPNHPANNDDNDRKDHNDERGRASEPQPTQTTAPAGAPVPIDEDNRSDANDGVERPLGFYSSQAQADRSNGQPGETSTNEAAGGPGFYSPEQQSSRNASDVDKEVVRRNDPLQKP